MSDDSFRDQSEREWREYLVRRIDKIDERLSSHMAWNLLFRVAGSSAFALLLLLFEHKLKLLGD